MRSFDLCSLVKVFQLSPTPCALGVHLEPATQSAEFKVLIREADESCVESSLCASTRSGSSCVFLFCVLLFWAFRVSPSPCALGVHLEPAVQRAEFNVLAREAVEPESSL
jgi:hypothetical protein